MNKQAFWSLAMVGMLAFGAASQASAQTTQFNFSSATVAATASPTNTTLLSTSAVTCTTTDRCSSNVVGGGGSMTFFSGALGVQVSGLYFNNTSWTNAVSVLDNNGSNPTWAGLGVYHASSGGAFVTSDDNITKNEALVLDFGNKTVTLKDLVLRAEGHQFVFDTAGQFAVSTSLINDPTGTGAGSSALSLYNFNATNGSITLSNGGLTGSKFYFYGLSDTANRQYYLSAASVVTAVPEPGTWASMLSGLAAVAFVVRRRRASPSAGA